MNEECRRLEAEAIELEARIAGLIDAAGAARSLSEYREMHRFGRAKLLLSRGKQVQRQIQCAA